MAATVGVAPTNKHVSIMSNRMVDAKVYFHFWTARNPFSVHQRWSKVAKVFLTPMFLSCLFCWIRIRDFSVVTPPADGVWSSEATSKLIINT